MYMKVNERDEHPTSISGFPCLETNVSTPLTQVSIHIQTSLHIDINPELMHACLKNNLLHIARHYYKLITEKPNPLTSANNTCGRISKSSLKCVTQGPY